MSSTAACAVGPVLRELRYTPKIRLNHGIRRGPGQFAALLPDWPAEKAAPRPSRTAIASVNKECYTAISIAPVHPWIQAHLGA